MSLPACGTLYVVATPIGNLDDLSARAAAVLSSVALILAEDTRRTRTLLERHSIRTRTAAYHEHNEARETPRALARLAAGESLALVSDAGTPLVSDPGARLVNAAIAAGIPVVPVPGASALLAAVVGSGLPAGEFTFLGFLPRRGDARTRAIAEVVRSPRTIVLYEAAPRVAATLNELAGAGAGERPAVIARELTKRFEEFVRGTVSELAGRATADTPRGEVVLVVGGRTEEPVPDMASVVNAARELAATGHSARDVAQALTVRFSIPRNEAYRIARDATSGRAGD